MKKFLVSALRAVTFGKFTGANFDGFEHPFVVVYGPNESGKSTITEFITWMIGGPVGNTSDAQRFGDAGSTLTGELNGVIGGDTVELAGKFNIQGNQQWTKNSAERKGYVGGVPVDSTSIESLFGGISSGDYAFIYRFIGLALHDTESLDNFKNLMSQFAMGSAASDVNPSSVEKELKKRADDYKKKIDAADKELRQIKKEADENSARPRRIAAIESRLNEIGIAIKNLEQLMTANARQEGFVRQALDAFDKSEALQLAKRAHDGCEIPHADWEKAVKSAADIRRILNEISNAQTQLESLRKEADAAAAKIGLTVQELGSRTFSIEDKNRIRRAGARVKDANSQLSRAKQSVADGSDAGRATMSAVREAAQKLGISSDDVHKISSLMGTWNELNNAAITWSNAEEAARLKQSQVASATISVEAAREKLASEEARQPGGISATRTNLMYPIAFVGIVGAIGALFSRYVSIAAGVVIVGLLAWSYVKKGKSSSDVTQDASQPFRDEVAHAERQETDAKAEAERARTDAEGKREIFSSRLSAFGVALPSSDVAQDLCLRIKVADDAVNDLAVAEEEQRKNTDNLTNCEKEASDAAESFSTTCQELGIEYSGDLDDLDEWIDIFDSAVSKSRTVVSNENDLRTKEGTVVSLLGAASSHVSGFSHSRLLDELKKHEEIAENFSASLAAVSTAQIAADAASGGKAEVIALLAENATTEELDTRLDALQRDTEGHSTERDKLIEERQSLVNERASIENVEYVNALALRRSEQEESKEESEFHRQAATLAATTLAAVIDVFERENQGPLVTRANELLNSVVPGYGDLVYKRDDAGKALIERVSETSRLRSSKLSVGSRALAYLALRLAFVEADHAKRGVALPVLCDDPLVHIDDHRAPEVMKILAQASGHRQVILFTCHEDTRDLAFAAGAHVVSLSGK